MRRGDGSLYDIVVPGYKANLSDVLASIALVQLDKVERTRRSAQRQFALYDEAVAGLDGIEPLARDPRDTHALHLYVVRIDAERAGATRDEYQRALADEGISTSIHFLPVHRLTLRTASASAAGRRCRSPSARAPRCSRCRSRPRTRTTTSTTRSTRCAACTRAFTAMSRARSASPRRSSSRGSRSRTSLWKIDLDETLEIARRRRPRLPRGRRDHGRHDRADGLALAAAARARRASRSRLAWLTRAYFVVVHGRPGAADRRSAATRCGSSRPRRRHPGRAATVAGSVLLERALGGAATLVARRGRLRARDRPSTTSAPISGSRALFVLGTVVLGFVFFSRAPRAAARPARAAARARSGSSGRCARVYEGMHTYRAHARLLLGVFALTIVVQAIRVLADLARRRRRSAIELSPRPYYVMGPLLFLVMLVPVHDQRPRGARGVLRQLPRQARRRRRRRRSRPGSSSSWSRSRWRCPGGVILAWEGLADVGAAERRAMAERRPRSS